jgi:hypothetical protein
MLLPLLPLSKRYRLELRLSRLKKWFNTLERNLQKTPLLDLLVSSV